MRQEGVDVPPCQVFGGLVGSVVMMDRAAADLSRWRGHLRPARREKFDGHLIDAIEQHRHGKAGDVRAHSVLGRLYRNGTGTPANPSLALSLFEKAAKAGSLDGMRECSTVALERYGKALDNNDFAAALKYRTQAERWLRDAADADDCDAMDLLSARALEFTILTAARTRLQTQSGA